MCSRRAFSLAELLLTITLAAFLIGSAVIALRTPSQAASSKAVASQLAEAFRAARAQAMAEQLPVALVLPTGGGPVCQSLAYLRGDNNPTVRRVLDYSKENPRTVIFVGTYGAVGNWTIDPPQNGRSSFYGVDQPGFPDSKPMLSWLGTRRDDVFLFLPDGSLITNDLPNLDGDYPIVVAQGVTAAPGSVPGAGLPVANPPPYNSLSAACDPYTIFISSLGAVTLTPGLARSNGSATIVEGSLPLGSVAAPLAPVVEPVTNPSLMNVTFFPPAGPVAGVLGVSGTLDVNRQLTLTVSSEITTSDDLFCNATATGFRPSAGIAVPSGSFSSPGAKRMYFVPAYPPLIPTGRWFSNWQWDPPPEAQPGDQFTFVVTVTTRRGGTATSSGMASLTRKIEIFNGGRLWFGGKDPYTSRYQIFMVRADGTDLTRVTHDEPSFAQLYPAATRDGNKMLFAAIEPFVSSDLYALSRTGGLSTRITNKNQPALRSNFSDDSAVGVYEGSVDLSAPREISVFDPNSAWPPDSALVFSPPLTPNVVSCRAPALSRIMPFVVGGLPVTGTRACNQPRRLAFESDCNNSGVVAIYTTNFANPGTPFDPRSPGANLQRQTEGRPGNVWDGGDLQPIWHPNLNQIAFTSDRNGGRKVFVVNFRENGTPASDGAVCLNPDQNNSIDPCYSPDGRHICWASDDGGWDLYVMTLDASGNAVPGSRLALNLKQYFIFTGGFTAINHPVWTL